MKPENSTTDMETDLFGKPLLPLKDPRGRPAFAKNKENQKLVADMSAFGHTHLEISNALRCDQKTLRKYFSRELQDGLIMLRAEAISVMTHRMRTGNMTAVKSVLEATNAQVPARTKENKEEPLGKKAMLKKSAAEAPSGWGDLLGNGKPVN